MPPLVLQGPKGPGVPPLPVTNGDSLQGALRDFGGFPLNEPAATQPLAGADGPSAWRQINQLCLPAAQDDVRCHVGNALTGGCLMSIENPVRGGGNCSVEWKSDIP